MKWQYKDVWVVNDKTLEATLNALGDEGWELANIGWEADDDDAYYMRCILKRPLTN